MNSLFSRFLISATAIALVAPAPLYAAKKVQSPYVSQGEWSLEHYGSYMRTMRMIMNIKAKVPSAMA